MGKRVTLSLSDEAAAILSDRKRIPFLEQGVWVSRAIVQAAKQEDANHIAALEQELARLKSEQKG
jgi:bacterioferritin (cytochrome b1)